MSGLDMNIFKISRHDKQRESGPYMAVQLLSCVLNVLVQFLNITRYVQYIHVLYVNCSRFE